MTGVTCPTYRGGFYAPIRGGRPKYPSLWKQCVGAWAPCLGATGVTLRDWSIKRNHGTLTNMDPGTDWVVGNGRHAIDFDGTNDVVEVPDAEWYSRTRFSISFWFSLNSTAEGTFISKRNSFGVNDEFTILTRAPDLPGAVQGVSFRVNGSSYIAGFQWTYVTNQWHAVTAVCRKDTTELWFDGMMGAFIGTGVSVASDGSATMRFGALGDSLALPIAGQMDAIMFHERALTPSEISLLALRRGIAFERDKKPRVKAPAVAPSTRRRQMLHCL